MPPSINPFDRKKQQVAKPVDAAKQAELLARSAGKPLPGAVPQPVTPGQKRNTNVIPAPPPARAVPGVTGTPPLPTGKVVGHVAPSDLTDVERATLEAAGWTPDIGLPTSQDGIKQLQTAIAEQMEAEVPLPFDPRNPPQFQMKTVPIESLPKAEQERVKSNIRSTIAGISQQEQATIEKERKAADLMAREQAVKGSGQALSATEQAIANFQKKVAEAVNAPLDDVPEQTAVNPAAVNAMKLQTHFAERAAQPQQEAPSVAPQAAVPRHSHEPTELGVGGVTLTHCPHCQWDLSVPDVEEPNYADKMSFLHCMIGDKPYLKEIPLFGGAVVVVLRTLTTKEIDKVYSQAYKDRQDGKLPNELDYWERVNRYRLMLQLQSFRSTGANGFSKDLPDGYSQASNPTATGFWVTAEQEGQMAPGDTGLPDIEAWMIDEVLKTEAVFRIVNNACNQFNRLVARLEAMADNSDFWKPTGEQS